jgi:hypothetical protein
MVELGSAKAQFQASITKEDSKALAGQIREGFSKFPMSDKVVQRALLAQYLERIEVEPFEKGEPIVPRHGKKASCPVPGEGRVSGS